MFISLVKDPNVQTVRVRQKFFALAISKSHFVQTNMVCPAPRFLSTNLSNEVHMLFCRNRDKRSVILGLRYDIFNIHWTMCPILLEKVFISLAIDPNVQFVRVRQDFLALAII